MPKAIVGISVKKYKRSPYRGTNASYRTSKFCHVQNLSHFEVQKISRICSSNHIAVRVIWDISPKLFSINFEITGSVSEGDFVIDKK